MHDYFEFGPHEEPNKFKDFKIEEVVKEKPVKKEVKKRTPRASTAKKTKADVNRNQGRELRIKNCPDCKGKPETEPFKAEPFIGQRCSKCWEVISWENETNQT